MSCRIIKEDSERKMTVMLTPFIPCSAKLPIISLFCQFFFKKSAWLVSFSFYLLAILIILVSAYCIKKIFYSKTSTTPFIQELPDYQWPRFSFLLKDINERILHFVKKTGSLILACSILLWFFLSFTWEMHYIDKIHYTIEDSILASIGKMFSWFFYPIIGELNWAATVSSFQGLIAKEQVVSSMAIIQGISQSASAEAIFSNQGMFQNFTPISAYAFVTFNLFSVPCLGSVSAMKQELGSKKRLILAIIFQIMIAWILSSFIFCLGSILKMIFY